MDSDWFLGKNVHHLVHPLLYSMRLKGGRVAQGMA